MVHSKPAQISRCTRAGGDNFKRCNSIPQSSRLSNRGSVVTSKFWSSCAAAKTSSKLRLDAHRRVQIPIDPTSRLNCPRLRLSLHLQVLVPPVPLSSSTAVTTYASSMRASRNLMKEPSALACDISNPFPPDLWGYVYGFGHHPEGLVW